MVVTNTIIFSVELKRLTEKIDKLKILLFWIRDPHSSVLFSIEFNPEFDKVSL